MLEAVGISRRFGWRWALREVSLNVERGRPLVLLGKNGSGKSTLLRTMAGLLRPTGGEVRFDGKALAERGRGRIGLLGHEPLLYPALTIRENLDFFGKLFGMSKQRVQGRIGQLAEQLDLSARVDEPVQVLSQGLRQRAALARALLHEPEALLLDEPFSGLDPDAARRLEETVRELCRGEGHMVVFSTHDIARARSMAGELAVLAEGKLVLRGDPADVSAEGLSAAFQGEGSAG